MVVKTILLKGKHYTVRCSAESASALDYRWENRAKSHEHSWEYTRFALVLLSAHQRRKQASRKQQLLFPDL